MTHEERIMAAIRGEALDRLPFIPRLDLWYQANQLQGTLPDKYRHASLIDIADDLGVGVHCVVPNFSSLEDPDDNAHVCLGLFKTKSVFYTVDVDVEYEVTHDGGATTTVYHTPFGDLSGTTYLDEAMKISGINQPLIKVPVVKTVEDYPKIAYIFDHMSIKPRYDYYYRMKEPFGDRGVVVGFQYEGGSPMHGILKEMSNFEHFWEDYYENIDEMEECCESIRRVLREILRVMADSPCEVLYVGANYDFMTTNPRFFEDYITPDLRWASDYLHSRGKYCLTHADGENFRLLDQYVEAHIDVADSVAPAPMTKVSLAEYREAFGRKITIWGGICAISVLEDSMSDYNFEKYVDEMLTQCGDGRNLILHVADSIPPAAKWERIEYLNKKIAEFGPVK